MITTEAHLAPWASPALLALDFRFPYEVSGPQPYIGYLSLFDRYADSEIGQHHAQQPPRFVEHFGYDEQNNYRQMVKDLGFNVHPRDHMQSVYGATQGLFFMETMHKRLERLGQWLEVKDFPIVRLLTPLHDVGENTSSVLRERVGGVVGDVPFGRKTAADKLLESKVRQEIFRMFYSDLPPNVLERVEAIASHSEDSPAHQTYMWVHDAEALETAYMAARHVIEAIENGSPVDERFNKLTKLAQEVGARTTAALRPGAKVFKFIGMVLNDAERLFDQLDAKVQTG